jgi:addiction module HigA family antidote
MKTKPTIIPRDPLKVPNPLSNPAAALIRDTLEHHGVSQVEAAKAMKLSTAQLSDVVRQRKGVSAAIALRFQFCFGIPADFVIRLQAQYDFQKAYHSKGPEIRREVKSLA